MLQILGHQIAPGESKTISFNIARLYTATDIEIPVIVERSEKPGPTVLLTAGIHGDEINGVEIVRQIIAKKYNQPKIGTIICIPILNVFGFLSKSRDFPDGRDLNRVFPGSKTGSLASRVAFHFAKEILPLADYCIDYHTGGSSRYNAAQIRVTPSDYVAQKYAHIFNPPFIVISKLLDKSFRQTCLKMNIPYLLFEGGKSLSSDLDIIISGVSGTLRLLKHLDMLPKKFEKNIQDTPQPPVVITSSTWIRAHKSGLLHQKTEINKWVEKGSLLATITDPYGEMRVKVKAPNSGYIININQSPTVHQGDAILHISTSLG